MGGHTHSSNIIDHGMKITRRPWIHIEIKVNNNDNIPNSLVITSETKENKMFDLLT